jgi:hypothetical protein
MPGRVTNPLTEKSDPRKNYCPLAFLEIGISFASKRFMGRRDDFIPALTAHEYKGFMISAWARPELTNRSTSVGIVYRRDKFGSIIQVKRIEGKLSGSKEQAEQHGVELCKEWIDKQISLAASNKIKQPA